MGLKKAVILLSGGLDSVTTLAIAKKMDFSCYALTFQYGQRHFFEISCAQKAALALGAADHRIIKIEPEVFAGSALVGRQQEVPKDRPMEDGTIPATYVPARNTIFLSYALAWAEVLGAWDIFIGVNAMDYSGYPDCRPAFIEAFEKMANLATAAAVEGKGRYTIHTPIIRMSKAQIIQQGTALGVDYSLTHSCYDPDAQGRPCGRCDSCRLRLKGFAQAGLTDPLKYPCL
ncbi:MAG TPA: 7-cyano-7-deazaguanine synthase QueC [Anaerohalosphaeraceae bacterium]|nr:7-cyano-7-deazaguanine synthase QueC [Phycisphaerae bacterium]HOK96748.1 7-cyano-7-deazaguanine synthase QueC [Anaerohalosphaeraceae bacterium]HOL32055.1 7-cyano-7-deazaguanine synthase QueC [Anaerohalosphaeraceae bacterium]HOM76261.1 7-cyano-7-deazaguanine synthase QueC [Anaerohalosphaeraceae bacterium]HPC64308.1 7-cyano-7-deazaguanine synthase QueC [Anaerohalosphaeraceae bacterium]